MALAIKVKNETEESLTSSHGRTTKQCPGCDPDSPGHVDRKLCKQCRGSGKVPLSFIAAFTELAESRRSACNKHRFENEDFLEY